MGGMSSDGSIRKRFGFLLVCVGVGMGVIVLMKAGTADTDRAKLLPRCQARLTTLGEGFLEYRKAHGGELPDRDGMAFVVQLHVSGSCKSPLAFFCWNAGASIDHEKELREGRCSFLGRRNSGSERLSPERIEQEGARIPLAADRTVEHHYDVRNVLFADGHVEEVDEETFQRDYASQLAA